LAEQVDILVFGSHPDDAELGCAGFLLKMRSKGYKTGIVDLTRGEMGSRGTPEIRQSEAMKSANLLSLEVRYNLEMNDGSLETDFQSRLKIINIIRKLRPSLVFTSYYEDKHPDHVACGKLVRDAFFNARLKKLETDYPHFAPKRLFFYPSHVFVPPVISTDITPFFEEKMNVLRAYNSQFIHRKNEDVAAPIGVSDHIFHAESRMRHFGSQINVKYAEGFITELPIPVEDIFTL